MVNFLLQPNKIPKFTYKKEKIIFIFFSQGRFVRHLNKLNRSTK